MLALLQKVTYGRVIVANKPIAEIGHGLLVMVGIEKNDTNSQSDRLLERILGYRIFDDTNHQMNLSVKDVKGGLLLVPQFTLAADTKKGMRPSFSPAASNQDSATMFHYLCTQAQSKFQPVQMGEFGANMQVELSNNGPVTIILTCR